jgi:hypothetical protein
MSTSIEFLETRIAPALIIAPNGRSATYDDVDGDLVTIKVSAGDLNTAMFTAITPNAHLQMTEINLSGGGFDGADLTFTVKKATGGDGLVNIGAIKSSGHDLGNVTIPGDLGQIEAGNGLAADGPGLKTLNVRSLGAYGLATQGGLGDLVSRIDGHAVALKVAGDVRDAAFLAESIGSVSIGGSLNAGVILSNTTLVSAKIGRDILGGAGANGVVQALGKLTTVTVGGSIYGGTGGFSGLIRGGELGTVTIARDVLGDLGSGSGSITSTTGAIGSVSIGGALRGGAGADSGKVESYSNLGAVKIGRDVQGSTGEDSGVIVAGNTLGPVTIGGSLFGGSGDNSGKIGSTAGSIGAVKIGGDVQGSSGTGSGVIFSYFKIASVSIGGSLLGGSIPSSGVILALSDVGAVKIGHDVKAGSSYFTGLISSDGKLASVSIGGSLIGGSSAATGTVFSAGDMGAVTIGGDLRGGSISGSMGDVDGSGLITSAKRIASVTIGGSIISGTDSSTGGALTKNATIRAGKDLGSLTVKGSLVGHVSANGSSPIVISAFGPEIPTPTSNVAIGKISIGGTVENASILAGYDTGLAPLNGQAQIGAVTVSRDWIASNLVAGARDTGAAGFGDTGDTIVGGGVSIAKIASIVIGGVVTGTHGSGDHFGFVSRSIGSFKSLGFNALLSPVRNQYVDLPIVTSDVTVREV